MEQNDLEKLFSLDNPWHKSANAIWMATTITLRRNLERFLFPSKSGLEHRQQVVLLISQELSIQPELADGILLKAEALTPHEKELLFEHFFPPEALNQAHSGEALFLNGHGNFMAMINLTDHLVLHWIDTKGEMEEGLGKLIDWEIALGKSLAYAFSPRFGFLTTDPRYCGTGIQMNAFLQVPALIHTQTLDSVLKKNNDDSLLVKNIQGEEDGWIGDIIVISNRYSLGYNEDQIVGMLRSAATKIEVEENSRRQKLMVEPSFELKDKISRAFGLLTHSYQLEAIEVLNALGLLKLGIALHWVEGIDNQGVNKLFLNSRRAHLLSHCVQEKLDTSALLHQRAEFLHKTLSQVRLLI